MPEYTKSPTGRFCWAELQTRDLAAARGFYGELFGWKLEDMMPGHPYAVATVNGKHVAGLTNIAEAAAQMGVPPHWAAYVAVEDVAASAAAAIKLGGKQLLGPTQMGPGTFAVIEDPTGGKFLLWHTTQPMGVSLYGEPGAVAWNELITNDVATARRFYTQLFGWSAEEMDMPGGKYTLFKQGTENVGGVLQQPESMKGAPSMWATYFAVKDADATFSKATKLGGKVLMPLIDMPSVGRFGWLQDPQGAPVAVIANPPQA